MSLAHSQGNFSLVRTMWLVWVVLFKAAVNVDCPQGISSRFMANIWALFALIFLAIYTANLAAFMITREEYFDFSGVHDSRLSMPQSTKPNFRFGTTPNGATDFILKKNFPEMQSYMRSKNFNQKTVKLGIQALKQNRLDAFIYDATVLEYLVGQVRSKKIRSLNIFQDDECNMLTVGSWYAMTGYGIAFPKVGFSLHEISNPIRSEPFILFQKSNWIGLFNDRLMTYRENGDLERLQVEHFQIY